MPRLRPGTGAVLLYHRVASLADDPWRLAVHPSRFAEHLHVIASTFRARPLSDLVRAAPTGDIPPGTVSVTFDDGYRDVADAAKPLLERHDVPATVFVVTGYIDSGQDFWWDVLQRQCRALAASDQFEALYRASYRGFQALGHEERQAILAAREAELGLGPASTVQTLTKGELESLADGGLIEIGAHSVTHALLTQLDPRAQLQEMRSSKVWLEKALGRAVESFSYPFGSYGQESAECARQAGFECACTSTPNRVTADTRLLELPRFRVEDWSGEELERRLSTWLAA